MWTPEIIYFGSRYILCVRHPAKSKEGRKQRKAKRDDNTASGRILEHDHFYNLLSKPRSLSYVLEGKKPATQTDVPETMHECRPTIANHVKIQRRLQLAHSARLFHAATKGAGAGRSVSPPDQTITNAFHTFVVVRRGQSGVIPGGRARCLGMISHAESTPENGGLSGEGVSGGGAGQ